MTLGAHNISKKVLFLFLLCLGLVEFSQAQADEFVIHVHADKGGSDPIDTALELERAHRAASPADTIILNFDAGVFGRRESITLGPVDSGTASGPFIIRGASDGGTTVSGAIIVTENPSEADHLQSDANNAGVRRPIFVSREELGLKKPLALLPQGTYSTYEPSRLALFQGDRRLRPARWPKTGYSTDIKLIDKGNKSGLMQAEVPSDHLVRWSNEKHLWLGGYPAYDWDYETAPIRAIQRDQASLIFDRAPAEFSARTNFRYFVFNALSELSEPGEYVVDPDQQSVSIIPFVANQPVESAVAETLLRIENVSHLIIEKIAFEKTLWTTITISDSQNLSFADCFVGHAGGDAVQVLGSNNVTFDRCVVTDTSERGIILSGGDRQNLTPANNIIRDSIVTRFGVDNPAYRPGIAIIGVGMTVEGCVIGDGPHSGIILAGNDNHIVRNELYSLVQETSDAGAIYMGRDWTNRGNLFAGNYFHDIGGDRSGIYLDDQISGTEIKNNVFARVGRPVVIGGGRDTLVEGNVFVAPLTAGVWIDNRGQTWQKSAFESNSQWMRNLKKVDISAPIWRFKYPTLENILTDDPGAPKNTVFQRNVSINGATAEFHESYAVRYVQQAGSIEMRLSTELTSSTSIEAISTLLGLAGDASGSHTRLANNLESLSKLLFARKTSLYP
jgi:Right handed beta helix region